MSNLFEVAKKDQLKEGSMVTSEIDGKQILTACVNGNYYAVERTCTHSGGRLDWGILDGTTIQCPKHRCLFDITNGKVLRNPGGCGGGVMVESIKTYPVKVDGDSIKIVI